MVVNQNQVRHKRNLSDAGRRGFRTQNQVSGMPSQRDFHKMQLCLEHITGELATQNKTLSIIEKTLERQQDYLMGNK